MHCIKLVCDLTAAVSMMVAGLGATTESKRASAGQPSPMVCLVARKMADENVSDEAELSVLAVTELFVREMFLRFVPQPTLALAKGAVVRPAFPSLFSRPPPAPPALLSHIRRGSA